MHSRLLVPFLSVCALVLTGCHQITVTDSSGTQASPGERTVNLAVSFCSAESETGPPIPIPDPTPPQDITRQCDGAIAVNSTDGPESTRYVVGLSLPAGVTSPEAFSSTAGATLAFERNADYAAKLQAERPIDGFTWHAWATELQTSEDGFDAVLPVVIPADAADQPALARLDWRIGGLVDYTTNDGAGPVTATSAVGCSQGVVIPPNSVRDDAVIGAATPQSSPPCTDADYDTVYSLDLTRADRCSNIDGQQDAAPAGMVRNEDGTCTAPPAPPADPTPQPTAPVTAAPTPATPAPDVCPNLAGVQTSVPAGKIRNIAGACVARPAGCTIVGTAGADVIRGTNGRDVICGLGGADRIYAAGGNDRISGGGGADVINGGSGHDVLLGGPGADRLSGGPGNDSLYGGSGNDTLAGGAGSDRGEGGAGADRIDGGSGSDALIGGSGPDRITGGAGHDEVHGGSGADRVAGASGNDGVHGGSGTDRVDGGRGNDRVNGDEGADLVLGGSGDDLLTGDDGTDLGSDRVLGGDGDDTIYGGAGADRLLGNAGDDVFYRSPGCDVWIGGSGIDYEIIIEQLAGAPCWRWSDSLIK